MIKLTVLIRSKCTPFLKLNDFPNSRDLTAQLSFTRISNIHSSYIKRIQSQLGSRSTALGYGIKFDFTKTDKYRPGPTSYDINTLFEQNIKHYKGVKFGYGREEAYKMGMLGNLNTAPGPGTYD